jgi:hypothetical protein
VVIISRVGGGGKDDSGSSHSSVQVSKETDPGRRAAAHRPLFSHAARGKTCRAGEPLGFTFVQPNLPDLRTF